MRRLIFSKFGDNFSFMFSTFIICFLNKCVHSSTDSLSRLLSQLLFKTKSIFYDLFCYFILFFHVYISRVQPRANPNSQNRQYLAIIMCNGYLHLGVNCMHLAVTKRDKNSIRAVNNTILNTSIRLNEIFQIICICLAADGNGKKSDTG